MMVGSGFTCSLGIILRFLLCGVALGWQILFVLIGWGSLVLFWVLDAVWVCFEVVPLDCVFAVGGWGSD